MNRLLLAAALCAGLLPPPALAKGARLLPELARGSHSLLLAQAGTDAPTATPPASPTVAAAAPSAPAEPMPALWHYGLGAGVGIVAAPVSLYLASWVGNLSISLLWSLLPAALVMGFVAPTAVTLAAWLVGNSRDPGRFGFWLAWGAASLANILCLVVAGFAGVSVGLPVGLLLFSVIDGLVVGGASVGTMRLFERRSPPVALRSPVPGTGDTTFVPLAQLAL